MLWNKVLRNVIKGTREKYTKENQIIGHHNIHDHLKRRGDLIKDFSASFINEHPGENSHNNHTGIHWVHH